MLSMLKIENIAIIELADISFSQGFNVMTGETGAGKSIIIDSINAVTGERTSKDLIRTGAQSAKVTAVFENVSDKVKEKMQSMGIEEDDTVILSRIIKKDGKNICTINGNPVTVSMLKPLGSELINIHGQHDNQALLLPEKHCGFIDSFGSLEKTVEDYAASFNELCQVDSELRRLNMDEQQKARRIDILTFQIEELEKAGITIGETQDLNERLQFLKNARNIMESLNSAYTYLTADGGGCDSVNNACYEIENISDVYDKASDLSQRLNDVKYELEDCCDEIRFMLNEAECDPSELEEIENRLDKLHRLSSKYGADEEEMLSFLDKAKQELESINMSEEKINQLRAKRSEIFDITAKKASALTRARLSAGERLSSKICEELRFLEMPNITFKAKRVEKELSADGCDDIEFLISANAGEELKPLAKTASGGELSRIMLAIKNSLAKKDGIDTMIFDEIDTGVSGSAARKIAEKLNEVSLGRQVICVTHLPQIAAFANCHMLITKSVSNEKTYTKVTALDENHRISELARLMGSGDMSGTILQSARELLDSCQARFR